MPDTLRPGIRTGVFSELDAALSRQGVEPAHVYARTGLQVTSCRELPDKIPVAQANELLEAASALTGNADFGLQFSFSVPVGASGLFGQMQAAAPTVRDLLLITTEYVRLVIAEVHPSWREDEAGGVFSARMPVELAANSRQLSDLLMGVLVLRIRLGAGQLWYPPLVTLCTSRPADDRAYESVFGSSIVYDADQFGLTVEREVLERPLPFQVVGLLDRLRPMADEELKLVDQIGGLAAIVRVRQREALAAFEPVSLEAVAERLGMSPRALQGRLARAGTSYEALLNEVRKDIATADLMVPTLTMSEISQRLGFSEPSAFSRWAQRELGGAPTEIRRRLMTRD